MKNDQWFGDDVLLVKATEVNGVLIGDIVKTKFLDVWRNILLSNIGMQIKVLDVDHYWYNGGLMLNATANGKKIGVGIHPSFHVEYESLGSENFYQEIEGIEFAFVTHNELKRLRKQLRSQGFDRPFVKNNERFKITDFPYKLKYSESFCDSFVKM